MIETNPNDQIRSSMLRYFYDRNAAATSRSGKKGSAVKISDVKSELKARNGLSQPQVMSNLTYLIDRRWVNKVDETKTVTTPRGITVPSIVTYYEISAEGIDRVEGGSDFRPPEKYAGINIHALGSNVITLGDGNVVQLEHRSLFNSLTELRAAAGQSVELTEEQKLSMAVDIESLNNQLAKPSPNRRVIAELWAGVERVAAVAGSLSPLISAIAPQIQHLAH